MFKRIKEIIKINSKTCKCGKELKVKKLVYVEEAEDIEEALKNRERYYFYFCECGNIYRK